MAGVLPAIRAAETSFAAPPSLAAASIGGSQGMQAPCSKLEYFPQYSPDYNPIEMVFAN
ncbi:MAG: transposase [Alphaproteobacteria bacterium]|nr:transposase [Alphaproteobacteria bacterium]